MFKSWMSWKPALVGLVACACASAFVAPAALAQDSAGSKLVSNEFITAETKARDVKFALDRALKLDCIDPIIRNALMASSEQGEKEIVHQINSMRAVFTRATTAGLRSYIEDSIRILQDYLYQIEDRISQLRRKPPCGSEIGMAPTPTGVGFGGQLLFASTGNTSLVSTSGFYHGQIKSSGALDLQSHVNFPIGSWGGWQVSAGVLGDLMVGDVKFDGTASSTPVQRDGHLTQLSFFATLNMVTPLASNLNLGLSTGVGYTGLYISGQPTGETGPGFMGHAASPAVRAAGWITSQVSQNAWVGGYVEVMHIDSTSFSTSLPDEGFRVGGITTYKAGVRANWNFSDIRLKRDIVLLDHLDNRLGLYRYRYLWSDRTYVGVMAQEVAAVAPDAVAMGADGYLRVNYARLGLRMQTWDEWRASH
jgi:hypothetical protein